jgi:regulator of replication initiation timing
MVLKIFSKAQPVDAEVEVEIQVPDQERIQKLEGTVTHLGSEVTRLRQEVNTLLARQDSFRMALRRLREYLEERGAADEEAQEVGAQFQDISHEEQEQPRVSRSLGKDKTHLH